MNTFENFRRPVVAGRAPRALNRLCHPLLAVIPALILISPPAPLVAGETPVHNVIIFVADGLRAGSVNESDAPTMYALQNQGVRFTNSHSLFPTVTTANASAIATGHALGDTGDFANTLFTGFPVSLRSGTDRVTPMLEDDQVLRQFNRRWQGNYLSEKSLLASAREHGCQTAVIGKIGPALIQDVSQANGTNGPQTIIIDDWTGRPGGILLPTNIMAALGTEPTPDRSNDQPPDSQLANGCSGDNQHAGTLAANVKQQQFFVNALTNVVLPRFATNPGGFVIVFWSRDPDGSQHNQGDSLNSLTKGINGPTSRAGITNCDANLAQILAALRQLGLEATTDVFITADHGFDTISRHEVDAAGTFTQSHAAGFIYHDATNRVEVETNFLPTGFLAIDLANFLSTNFPGHPWPLFDPDQSDGHRYLLVNPTNAKPTASVLQRPSRGNGLIGGTGQARGPTDAAVVVTTSGGSDLIYIPKPSDFGLVPQLVDFLTRQDYVSGIFVNNNYGNLPGALSFTNIDLMGSARTPKPAIIVNFRSFSFPANEAEPLQHGVVITDTDLQEGQGNHGGFDRAATWNFMAACGPDFKTHYTDPAPVSNRDIAVTLAEILKFEIKPQGRLTGRIIAEALVNRPDADLPSIRRGTDTSAAAQNGLRTLLNWQEYDRHRYFDAAGFPGRTLGLREASDE